MSNDWWQDKSKNGTPHDETGVTRREFLVGGSSLAAAALLSATQGIKSAEAQQPAPAASTPSAPPQGYNILLVFVDQERYFDRYPFPVPGRERLMQRGVTFTHHENNSNVCTSSRSVVYTGWHMPQTGLFDNMGLPWITHDLDPSLGTLGTLLTDAGYYAAYKGKFHLNREMDALGDLGGGGKVNLGQQPTAKFNKIMQGYGFQDYHGIGDVIGWSQGGYLYDSETTGQTINWLRGTGHSLNRDGKPWFLAVNLVNPHDVMFIDTDEPGQKRQWKGSINDGGISMNPAQPPNHEIYRAAWDDVPLPASRHQSFTEPGRPPAHLNYQLARAALVGQFPDEDRRWRKLQNYYFNCIRDCDTHVERILAELDRLMLTKNTIIVFTADHGELGGHHQMHGKGSSVYRQQMHVPLVVVHPAYPGGKRCNALTCHLDIAPTLIGLTGLPESKRKAILGKRKGKDLSPLLSAPEKAAPHAARDASLYCYSMILYMDPSYLAKLQETKQRTDLTATEKKEAIAKLKPDFSKRSGIRCITDGRYKFARYFSLEQHNMPTTMKELFDYNDVELFDLSKDPDEMRNLANDPKQNGDVIMAMNEKLNALIKDELGQDDGSYMNFSGITSWDIDVAIE